MSFAAIQEQERERNTIPAKPKTSLREIQAEEARREADRQQEEDFMRWWNAEEARIQAEEAETLRRLTAPVESTKPPRRRAPKKKPGKTGPMNVELPAR